MGKAKNSLRVRIWWLKKRV